MGTNGHGKNMQQPFPKPLVLDNTLSEGASVFVAGF
jgi:hypothetical protein